MSLICDLCEKPLDRQTEAVALLTCEVGHVNRVHQKCFEKSIDKAIRVRSTRSASFENIARSATHSWKTQKCAQPDCIKWLESYVKEDPLDGGAAIRANAAKSGGKSIIMSNVTEVEEEESSEEDSDRCSGIKADGSPCNFPVTDFELGQCRRCAAKTKRQAKVTAEIAEDKAKESKAKDEKANDGDEKEKVKKSPAKKSKTTVKKTVGLNSMLKSLAKPAEELHPANGNNGHGNGHGNGPNGQHGPNGPMTTAQQKAMQQQMARQGHQGRGTGSIPEIPGDRPMEELMKFPDGVTAPTRITNDGQLLESIRLFVRHKAVGNHNRATPRDIARFLDALPGGNGSNNGPTTGLELLRRGGRRLKGFLESHPSDFVLHNKEVSKDESKVQGGDTSFEVSLTHQGKARADGKGKAQGQGQGQAQGHSNTRDGTGNGNGNGGPNGKGGNGGVADGGVASADSASVVGRVPENLLAEVLPKTLAPLPEKTSVLLEGVGLSKYHHLFEREEFLPCDLLLCTDADLKEIGLPVGPRVKLRNWIKSQIQGGGASATGSGAGPVGNAGGASAQGQGQGPNQGA